MWLGRVNSSKFKALFHTKPGMIPRDRVFEMTGFAPGGVCPFGVPADIPVWLDVSMKRFEYVHPAGGNELAIRSAFSILGVNADVDLKRDYKGILGGGSSKQ